MDVITVDKGDLIAKLQTNRDEHYAIFAEAQKVYRRKMIEELDRALTEAKNGGAIRRGFTLPVPENHTDDFDTAIQMLEWHQGDQIDLGYREFKQYVENEWGWQKSFAANSIAYTEMAD